MDLEQIRALELELEQVQRCSAMHNDRQFWQDPFEIHISRQIAKLRRESTTYKLHYV